MVHSSNVRAFERALSIAGTVSESNANENYSVNSDLDAQSIKTFSDFDMADGISDLDDRSPHSSSKVAVKLFSFPVVGTPFHIDSYISDIIQGKQR